MSGNISGILGEWTAPDSHKFPTVNGVEIRPDRIAELQKMATIVVGPLSTASVVEAAVRAIQ
jgi:hypothetical protein